jgi:hypothetical protein
VSDNREFCGKCGAKLDSGIKTGTCPSCGANINSDTTINNVDPTLERQPKRSLLRKISVILGIIVGIYSFVLIVSLIEYNMRLSSIRETTFGLGNLIVARIAPSIELSSLVGLLFLIETIILFVKPKPGKLIALVVLGLFNILLTSWIINQIPQILYELFTILSIGILLNIFVIIYSAAGYRRVKSYDIT